MTRELIVRHFRQILVWPLQLMPLRPGEPLQRHWERCPRFAWAIRGTKSTMSSVAIPGNSRSGTTRNSSPSCPTYSVSLRFGGRSGIGVGRRSGEPARVPPRRCGTRAHHLCAGHRALEFKIAHIISDFFLDADIAILAFEMYANDILLDRAQDTLFRFGRAYPAFWDRDGSGGNCPQAVEWLNRAGEVLATSDFAARAKYLSFAARYRSPCIADHWEYLLAAAGAGVSGTERHAALSPARVLPHAVHVLPRPG